MLWKVTFSDPGGLHHVMVEAPTKKAARKEGIRYVLKLAMISVEKAEKAD